MSGWKSLRLAILLVIIIIIEGLSLLQSIPPTTADKQTQAQNSNNNDNNMHQHQNAMGVPEGRGGWPYLMLVYFLVSVLS